MRKISRIVSTGFWEDTKVTDKFSPEDRYFMLYLLTNTHTTQLGIYELPISRASNELGYTPEVVSVLLERFDKKYGIIKRSSFSGEIAIKNYLRYSIVKGGKPVYDCLVKEEKDVKDKSLLYFIFTNLENHSETINETVKLFMQDIKEKYPKENINTKDNDNDNENENERIVDDSWTIRKNEPPVLIADKKVKKTEEPYFPDEELNQAFLDYMDMRKKIKSPMTEKAVSLAIKKLNELAKIPFSEEIDREMAINILNQSVMNSWKGLFPIKGEKKEKVDWDNV